MGWVSDDLMMAGNDYHLQMGNDYRLQMGFLLFRFSHAAKVFCFRFLEIVTKLGLENLKPGVWNFEFWRVAKVDLVLDQVACFLDLLILDQVPWKLCPLVF